MPTAVLPAMRMLPYLMIVASVACGGLSAQPGARQVQTSQQIGVGADEGDRLSPNGPSATTGTASSSAQETTVDPLPTGAVSTLEVPAPGQTSVPGGGNSSSTNTSPQCPSKIQQVSAKDCSEVDASYRAKHQAYCDYMRNPTPGSEGGTVPFDDIAALQSLATVGSQCCQMDTSGSTTCN